MRQADRRLLVVCGEPCDEFGFGHRPAYFEQFPAASDSYRWAYFVWLGVLQDNNALEHRFTPLAERTGQTLSATGLPRGSPELIVLDPEPRSRMRRGANACNPVYFVCQGGEE